MRVLILSIARFGLAVCLSCGCGVLIQTDDGQARAHLTSSSSGSSAGTTTRGGPGVPWKKLRLGLAIAGITAGLALVVLGVILPIFVGDMVTKGITDAAVLDPQKFSDSAAHNFYNQTTHQDFYLFNITNLFAVLTKGDTPDWRTVGPIRTIRYPNRYDVQWDTGNSRVSYRWLDTFEVFESDKWLLSQPIIGPNAFYFGLGAQVMSTFLSTMTYGNDVANHPPVVDFPGRYVNDQASVTGFFSQKVLGPQIATTFSDVTNSALLSQVRLATTIFYTQVLAGFGLPMASVLGDWVVGTNFCNALGSAATACLVMFYGFELNTPITDPTPAAFGGTGAPLGVGLACSNALAVAEQFFNTTGEFGCASKAGLARWGALAANQALCLTLTADATAYASCNQQSISLAMGIAVGLTMTFDASNPFAVMLPDIIRLAEWIKKMVTGDLATDATAQAAERVVAAAITGAIQQAYGTVAGLGGTPFNGAYGADLNAVTAAFTVSSFADMGALQFGSGALVAILDDSFTTGWAGSGNGKSTTDLDPTVHLNVPAGPSDPEPLEFQAGIKYYIAHNGAPTGTDLWPAGADQSTLWQTNPSLLYADGASATTLHNLNVAQTKAMFGVLLTATGYPGLIGVLQKMTGTYAYVFQMTFEASYLASAPDPNDPVAVGMAKMTAAGAGVMAAVPAVNAKYRELCETSGGMLNRTDTQSFITTSNWFAVWTYLYLYMANELTGTLAQLDPTTGIAVQNSGMFSRSTVGELLFGSNTAPRFQAIPPIAGVLLNSDNYNAQLDADRAANQGRLYVTDTGHANINNVGQWIEYKGVAQYRYNCELIDPRNKMGCNETIGTPIANNYTTWGAPSVIAGSGGSTQIGPFKEKVEDRQPSLKFYVNELKRTVTAEYKYDVNIRGIDMRRYGLWEALTDSEFVTPNPEKNDAVWKQANVPKGLFSLAPVNGGLPIFVSLPMFGLSNPGEINAGSLLNGKNFSENYVPALHDTFLDIESLSGFTMNGAKRLQANFRVTRHEYFTTTSPADETPISMGGTSPYPAKFPPGYTSHPLVANSPLVGLDLTMNGGINMHYNNLFANGREEMYRQCTHAHAACATASCTVVVCCASVLIVPRFVCLCAPQFLCTGVTFTTRSARTTRPNSARRSRPSKAHEQPHKACARRVSLSDPSWPLHPRLPW